MKRLYFVRHGETDWNKYNKVQGCVDTELNQTGIVQAKKVAERLKDEKIDAIFTSSLKRAYLTAQQIRVYHPNIEFVIKDEIREIGFGEWEGLTVEELERNHAEQYRLWKLSPEKAIFPGEGNLNNVLKRVKVFLDNLLELDFKRIVIVTHGGIIKLSVIYLLELSMDFYKKCWFGNASLSIIDIKEDKKVLTLLNDMSHLQWPNQHPIF